MSYDYDEPEAAAIDLLEDEEDVVYGMVIAQWSGEGDIQFFDTDSTHHIGSLEVEDKADAFDELVELLVRYDEEFRSEL